MARVSLLDTTAIAGLSIAASLAIFAAFSPLHAQSTWTGATSNDYGTAGNWSGGTPPPDSSTQSAVFNTGGANTNVNVATPTTVNNWTFQGSTGYALTGSAITFSGNTFTPGIISTTNAAVSIANVFNGVDANLVHDGNGSITLTGVGSVIGGQLINLGGPTAAGKIEIKGGSLTVGTQTRVFGGTLAVTQGGTLTSQNLAVVSQFGTAAAPAAVVSGTNSAWNVQNDLVIGGAFGGAGGAGTLTIADGGTVTVSPTFSASIASGSTLNLGTGALAGSIVADTINNDGQIVANFTNTTAIDATITGAGSVTKIGSGKLILTGATNSYSGDTVVTGGTLTTTNGGALGNSIAKFSNGTTLQLDGSFGFTNAVTVAGNVNVDVTLANTASILGDISDGASSGGITKTGVGTLVLAGNNSYGGATNVDAGTLQIDSGSALPQTTDMKVNAGATLELTDGVFADINSLANGASGGGTVKIGTADSSTTLFVGFTGGATTTFGGSIVGAGNLEVDGGSLTLTGVSSIGGDLLISACGCATSTLTISGPGASFTAAGSGQFTLLPGTGVAGTLNVLNGAAFNTANLLIEGTMTVDGANSIATITDLTFVGAGSTAASLTISGGAVMNSQFGAIIENLFAAATTTVTGSNSVWNVDTALAVGNGFAGGPGYLVVSAGGVVNSTGPTNIGADLTLGMGPSTVTVTGAGSTLNAGGLLAIGYSCCGDLAGTLTVADGGRVNATGGTEIGVLGVLNLGTGGLAGTINTPTITNNGQIVANFTDTSILAANIDGSGSLSKAGAGTLILSGTNTYSGTTTISEGVLALGNGGATGSILGGVVDNGTLAFNRSDSYVFAGVISGSGAVRQDGAGTTTLTGNNTYGGGTFINAGTLAAGADGNLGNAAGGITFNGPGTLQFLGGFTSARAVTLNANGTFDTNGNNDGLAGSIAGSGGLIKTGAGLLTLSGNNSYAGSTSINAGRLAVNGGNAIPDSSAVTVAAGASLGLLADETIGSLAGAGDVLKTALAGPVTLTTGSDNASTIFSGVISNGPAANLALSLTKIGIGTFTLTNTSTYTGATTVNAGTLSVNGSIVSSSGLTVNAGGTVGGTGFLPNTLISGGTLSPGNSIGTITVANNLSFVGPGNYIIEVSPTAADRTNVTGAPGTASLAGTLRAVGTGGTYAIGTRYTVLNATGSVSGTFASLAVTGSFGVTKPQIEYDANNVYLVLAANAISPTLPNGTRDQRAIAAAIDAAILAGSQAAPFAALFALAPGQLPAALDALSGEVHASTAGVLVDESLYVRSAILGRLRQASYGGDTSMASLSMGGPQTSFVDEELNAALGYAKSPIVTKAPLFAPAPSRDIVFWSQGFGAWGKFNSDGDAAAVKRDLAGFVTGFDARFGNWRGGVAAGYTGSRNNTDGRGSANVDTGHVAAYGGVSVGALNLRAGGAYAFHTIDTDRTINFPGFFDRATAHYQGGTGQIFGEVGYGFAFGKLAVEPFAGAAWVRLDTDAFSEKGGAAALNVAANSFEVGYSTLGVRAASLVPLDNGMVVIPRASAAWQHAFNSVTPDATLAFQGAAATFVIAGVPIARDALLAEAGLDLAINRNATIGVSYTGQIASNVADHAAKGRFSWKFN